MSVNGSFKAKPKVRREPERAVVEEWRYPRVDPIAHAWRACNPLTPIPMALGKASRTEVLLGVQTGGEVDSAVEGVDGG